MCLHGWHGAGLQIARQADLKHGSPVAHSFEQFRIVLQADTVADACRSMREYGLANVVRVAALARVDRDGNLKFPCERERFSVRRSRKMRFIAGKINAHHALL